MITFCLFVGLTIVQGFPAEVKDQQQPSVHKEFRPQQLGPIPNTEESQEAGEEEKDLSSSNTIGFGYYGYPRYRSYYPSYYGGYYGGYRSYGYGHGYGYGGYYSPNRYYGGWY